MALGACFCADIQILFMCTSSDLVHVQIFLMALGACSCADMRQKASSAQGTNKSSQTAGQEAQGYNPGSKVSHSELAKYLHLASNR
jgi:hypothetical protein